jgi:brefeldin A-resistance guanine nucleotide exchange factor 1
LPSILELLRVLVNVLDPNDQQHTDSTRLTALGILNAAFEESGPTVAQFPSLKAIVIDPGCKFLFQLARSENNLVLHLALRTISTILDTMRKHLKLQQELFLTFTIDRLSPPNFQPPGKGTPILGSSKSRGFSPSPRPGTPSVNSPLLMPVDKTETEGPTPPARFLVPPARGETRDLILETLGRIAGHPSFMVDLYTNYDCDINCENLFERLIDFLTKAPFIIF